MKRVVIIAILFFFCFLFLAVDVTYAQCSICSRTAEQMGEKSALGLNSGIIYLMLVPFLVVGIIGYRWWKRNEGGSHG